MTPGPERSDAEVAHEAADAIGHDGYVDPQTGLFVMTRGYLVRRGSCCSSGCRHCPYPPETEEFSATCHV